MNKGLFHFRELVTHWLIQMPYLESVLLGEQIICFWVCSARVKSGHVSIFLVWKTRRFLIMRPVTHGEGVTSSRYQVGIYNYAWNQTRMEGVWQLDMAYDEGRCAVLIARLFGAYWTQFGGTRERLCILLQVNRLHSETEWWVKENPSYLWYRISFWHPL